MKRYHIKLSHFHLLATVVAAVLMCGCAGVPRVLPPEARSQVRQTTVHCYVPQSEIKLTFMQSSYGAGGGLIGALVDLSINSAKASSAEKRARRIGDAVRDHDFRSLYWGVASNAVAQSSWLQMQTYLPLSSAVRPVDTKQLAGSVVNVGADYQITPDHRVFQVISGYSIFIPGKNQKPAAAGMVAYHSARIGNEEGDKAVDLWVKDGAAAYRKTADEGLRETDKLLRLGFDYLGGVGKPGRPAKVKADFVHGRADFGIPAGRVTIKGQVLEETDDRVIFLADKGAMFSLPKAETEVTYLPQT